MNGVNKVILIGQLGQDPELRLTDSSQVASVSLATNEKYKNKAGELVNKTEWHNLVFWGKLAGVVSTYCKKGYSIYIEGKLTTQTWEKDGVKHYKTVINCNVMNMLGSKGEQSAQQENGYDVNSGEPDDLPF